LDSLAGDLAIDQGNKVKYLITGFDRTDGLQIMNFVHGSGCCLKNGNLIFAGSSGIVSFDPLQFK
jgi:hypothetical protein